MHYQDDYYHPNAAVYEEEEECREYTPSEPDTELSQRTQQNRRKNIWEESKKLDKGYFKITRIIDGKKKDIDVYSTTTTPGRQIRDAVTGANMYDYKVGSRNEHQLFKIGIATGECGKDMQTFFFDTPEKYERHFFTSVSAATREAWIATCIQVRQANAILEDARQVRKAVIVHNWTL